MVWSIFDIDLEMVDYCGRNNGGLRCVLKLEVL